jgi:gag-polypeptide of LTR copia-type
LLARLKSAELTKPYEIQSAHVIWPRLADEHGAVSKLRRVQAEAAFDSLLKKEETLIHDHINAFTKLQQEVDDYRGSISHV